MIFQTALAAAILLGVGLGSAGAAEIGPGGAASIDLGSLSGVAYYTPEARGYRVVVTLAPRAAAPAMRFEAVLGADQSMTLSTPRAPGDATDAIEIARVGDSVQVRARRTGDLRQAAALD
ncbi:hypothetical protein DK427_10035 [Methylobacterium radiodurans]|uniref:Uncharacterized protein n=2 Tax=Methylobacterium radiodurans TaxID=2202828 RepID=A0A2U8VYR5_9HYPH|nr:hypothetical protein DK427_10035 [Methylobacterium radiodurans]